MRRDTYNIDRPIFSDYLFEDWTCENAMGIAILQELSQRPRRWASNMY